MKFNELIKNKRVLQVLEEMNFETPTKIQEEIIPLILDGNDVLGQSQTGTGKTLAFTLPMLENLEENKVLQTLILAPTRELAIQIEREIEKFSQYMKINTTCVYGSSSIEAQIKSIKKGSEIVVGTPGRVKDLIKRKVLKLSEIRYFVLDEADEMLSMGFQEEIEFIFDKVKNDRQVLLFSATMPSAIKKIATNYMSKEYRSVSVVSNNQTAKNIEQEFYVVNSRTRLESLCRIMDFYNPKRSIIFSRTKRNADELLEDLSKRGYSVDVIHGDIVQSQRIATLDRFKDGIFNYLIATDVAARGIHVDDIDIVFNYNLPESNEAYVHRIGRTGRVDKKGVAVTLVTDREKRTITDIERRVKSKIVEKKLPSQKIIENSQVDKIINSLDKNYQTSNGVFKEYLETLEIEELKNLTNKLLLDKLTESLGSNFTVDTELAENKKKKNKKRDLKDSTRVFLTIGTLDGIKKREFLSHLEKVASVGEGTFTGMEIMTKFTFVNVNNKHLDVVLKKCNNIKYKNRLIRVEVAKK